MQALLGSLTESERALVRETEREQMSGLDEDALVAKRHATTRVNVTAARILWRTRAAKTAD